MPCHRIEKGFVCWSSRFLFDGYYFEWHEYCGPTQLRKDGMPRVRSTKGFWDAIEKFCKLSEDERKQYEVG